MEYFQAPEFVGHWDTIERFHENAGWSPAFSPCIAMMRNIVRTQTLAMLPGAMTIAAGPDGNRLLHDPLDDLVRANPILHYGLSMVLSAIAINAWTTFESLAADLWVAAVNARPNRLGKAVGGSKDKGAGGVEPGKGVLFDDVAAWKFDLRQHVGDLLATKFVFTNLKDAKRAYDSAFGKLGTKAGRKGNVHGALSDPKITLASQVRHVLVHNGGVVDQDFIDKTGKIAGMFPVRLRDDLPLDGKVVVMLVDDTTRLAIELMQNVDGWLSKNPD